MKKKNCVCEFSSERSEVLIRNYREALARASKISIMKIFGDLSQAPAPRFWVSEARAVNVVKQLMKDDKALDGMHTEKRKMYLEIYRRVMEMKEESPEMPLGDIVFEVVNSPAPSFYLSKASVAKLIYSSRR